MSQLKPLNQIEDQYRDILILENGASVAVHKGFNYKSLKAEAKEHSWLTENVLKVFEYLKTDEFEPALSILSHTDRINQILEVTEKLSSNTYRHLNAISKTFLQHSKVLR